MQMLFWSVRDSVKTVWFGKRGRGLSRKSGLSSNAFAARIIRDWPLRATRLKSLCLGMSDSSLELDGV